MAIEIGRREASSASVSSSAEGSDGYEPGNCRWVSSEVQASNKRNNRHCELLVCDEDREIVSGRMTITEAAQRLGLSNGTVYARLRRGWPLSMALAIPA